METQVIAGGKKANPASKVAKTTKPTPKQTERSEATPQKAAADGGQEQVQAPTQVAAKSAEVSAQPQSQEQPQEQVSLINLSLIESNPFNPRLSFDREQLQELATSVATYGIIQPITVRPLDNGHYQIVCGERRYAAAMVNEMDTIRAIVKNYSDEQAQEITLVENLQRADVSPVEEAAAFKQLMTLRGYTIEELTHRFGKSDRYVRSRLQLSNLIEEMALMLGEGHITMTVALEIARHSTDIQQEAYNAHFAANADQSWIKLSAAEVHRRMEQAYCSSLANYPFDKTECNSCKDNTLSSDLFAASEGSCGNCQNRQCLYGKCVAHIKEAVSAIAQADPQANFFVNNLSRLDPNLREHIEGMGFDVREDYGQPYPRQLGEPRRDGFDTQENYEQAVADYPDRFEKYNAEIARIDAMVADGKAVKMYSIEGLVPHLCYKLVAKDLSLDADGERAAGSGERSGLASGMVSGGGVALGATSGGGAPSGVKGQPARENPEQTIKGLQAKDKRNKEIAVEKSIANVKDMLRQAQTPVSEFTPQEDTLLYFIMLSALRRDSKKTFGLDELGIISDERKVQIAAALTKEQKTIIRRDFILKHLNEASLDNTLGYLLLDFAAMHFPEDTAALRAVHDAVYEKRHTSIAQRIVALEDLAKEQRTESGVSDAAEAGEGAEMGEAKKSHTYSVPQTEIAETTAPGEPQTEIAPDDDDDPGLEISVPADVPATITIGEPEEEIFETDAWSADQNGSVEERKTHGTGRDRRAEKTEAQDTGRKDRRVRESAEAA